MGDRRDPANRATDGMRLRTGFFPAVTWIRSDQIVAAHRPIPEDYGPLQIWQLTADGKTFNRVRLPDDPLCQPAEGSDPGITDFLPGNLPDGRLELVRTCRSGLPRVQSVLAHNLETGVTEVLVEDPGRFGIGNISWNPSLDRALVSHTSGLCASFAWLTRNGLELLSLQMGSGERTWNLDEDFRSPGNCENRGRANNANWAPGGESIAFFASPESVGVVGHGRLDVPWNLYLMSPNELKPRVVFNKVFHADSLRWSPDGQWLSFRGEIHGRGEGGFAYSPNSDELVTLVTEPLLREIHWSPDGTKLVGIVERSGEPQRRRDEIWIWNVNLP
jgi:hypothetical protein